MKNGSIIHQINRDLFRNQKFSKWEQKGLEQHSLDADEHKIGGI